MTTTLKILRKERGLSLKTAGDLVGATAQAQLRWERREAWPQARFRDRLERVYGQPVEALLSTNTTTAASE